MKYLILIAISAMSLLSCKSTQKTVQSSAEMFIEGNQWEMTSFMGKSTEEAGFTQKTPFIVINKEKESMGGNSGCNSFGGKVTINENSIEMGMFMATKMYCHGVPETEFFKALDGMVDFKIEGKQLTFFKDGTTLMTFQLKTAE